MEIRVRPIGLITGVAFGKTKVSGMRVRIEDIVALGIAIEQLNMSVLVEQYIEGSQKASEM